MVRILSFFTLMLMLSSILAPVGAAEEAIKADRVVVKKSQRLLFLFKDNQILHRFEIALGDEPEGHKLEEGDWRTPEGLYVIDWRNPRSRFYKSLHISYPNERDIRESAAQGVDPGGMIMIHGLPPEAVSNPENYVGLDWTDGCIALRNEDMDIVWSAVDDGTPIEILP